MKKIIVLLLVLVLSLNMVACTSSEPEESAPVDEVEGTVEETEKEAEPVTISVVIKDISPTDPQMVSYFDLIEEGLAKDGLNINVELVEMPAGTYAEKLNLMLLGGDIPDLIYFQGGDEQMAAQGLLEDLTPYIEESTYIKDNLFVHNKERLSNYPYLLWIKPVRSKVPVIRADWFEATETGSALLEDPSIDNYYEFLKELKDEDFDGNGAPAYGITVAGKLFEINQVFNQAFGLTSTWIQDDNGDYIYGKVSDVEKQKLEFYAKLYSEGILDKEYLTKKWDTKEQAFYDNEVGVIIGTSGKVVDIYDGKMKKTNGAESELVVLPPANGVGQGYMPVDTTKESRGFAISALSEHKDEVFAMLEYLASPEGQKLDRLGFEDVHYEVVNGKIETTEKAQEWWSLFWEPLEVSFSDELATPLLGAPSTHSLELANKYYTKDINIKIPEEQVPNWDAMENLYKEFSADVITGKISIDKFDDFVDDWYNAGGTQITEYANEVLK